MLDSSFVLQVTHGVTQRNREQCDSPTTMTMTPLFMTAVETKRSQGSEQHGVGFNQ
jgi:hypothetical protein